MTVAANRFLKYLRWAAHYSAWYGIAKYAAQWRMAGARTSFYGWVLLLLEAASAATIYGLIRFRSTGLSRVFGKGVRLVAWLAVAIFGSLTALPGIDSAFFHPTSAWLSSSAKIPPEATWANSFSASSSLWLS